MSTASSSSTPFQYPKAKHPIPRPLQLPEIASGSSPNSAGVSSPSGFASSPRGVKANGNGAHYISASPVHSPVPIASSSSALEALTSPLSSSYPYPNRHSLGGGQRNAHSYSASGSSSRPLSRTSYRDSGGAFSAASIGGNGNSSPAGTPIRSPTSSKRQSTISYFSPDQEASRERDWKRLSAASGGGPSGGLGLVGAPGGTRRSASRPRSVGSASALGLVDDAVEKERPKLTLVEQHADLLHSIAAKEAQCLELRTQLATNEDELAQLKRKWERIVNRGPDREAHMANSNTAALLAHSPLSPLTSSLTTSTSIAFGLGMEGLKGGVQEVSRLLSVGLTSGGGASASSSRPPSRQGSISRGPSPLPGGSKLERGSSQRHRAKESSNSSSSTTQSRATATSTGSSLGSAKARHRLSQCSSATSLEDNDEEHSTTSKLKDGSYLVTMKNDSIHNSPQELIITDTGATPTMSPNPAFLEQTERRKRRKQEGLGTPSDTLTPDAGMAVDDDPWDVWGNGSDAPSPSLDSPAGSSMQAKPLDGPGAAASSAGKGIVGGIGQGWMDTVGKKLGELQKSSTVTALSKSQKRASLMFSDMGQSIASALTDPGTPSTRPLTHSPLALSANMSSSTNTPTTPATSRSLLDDDDDDEVFGRMISAEPVLKPDNKDSRTGGLTSALKSSTSSTKLERRRSVKVTDDETDGLEWGW
ncbi:hypothetical protein BKA70DRAFT_1191467 [Coprinopsis sp. MPI-PUGE-AT-0042]|nr:hypothetical protein BKA70DRAFT_1191467 [Coprinopsis sp. MPI-PUGE-AT-0042]